MHCTHKMQFSSEDLNQCLSLQNPVALLYLQNSNNPDCRDELCFSAWVPLTPGPQQKPGAVSWLSLECKVLLNFTFSIFPANKYIPNSLRTFVWTKLPVTGSARVLCNACSCVAFFLRPLDVNDIHWRISFMGAQSQLTTHSAGISILLGNSLVIDCEVCTSQVSPFLVRCDRRVALTTQPGFSIISGDWLSVKFIP